jgi:hypothetical protein
LPGGSAKKLITVSLFGSRPFSTFARWVAEGKAIPRSLKFDEAFPVDGRPPTYRATSGSASSTLKAPTMKNVKSAAFANRRR